MKIEQIYTGCLAQGAYYIESEGEAAIIDPLRETDPYIKKAANEGATIKYIFETHFHADFVSGHLDLAKKTGATIVYGPDAQTEYEKYNAKDGEEFKLGKLTFKVLHTPGHTLESTTFLLIDENGKNHAIFSGDTLFIGDVGRPDLSQKNAATTKEQMAAMLYESLRTKIMTLENDVIVYPAHGAGSACGKNMSSETYDTLGNQKKTNYALRADMTKEEFIKEVTDGILPPPNYFAMNAKINKVGYESFEQVMKTGAIPLSVEKFEQIAEYEDALILDTRHQQTFAKGFIPNSIFIGIDGSFAPWVGTLITDINQAILIIADEGREKEVVMRLARVGYDNTLGFLEGGVEAWTKAGKELDIIASIPATALAEKYTENKAINILDVRKNGEYDSVHVEGAINLPLDYINDNMNELDRTKTYFIHCRSGYRSMVHASILRARGFEQITDIAGGMNAIKETNLPTVEMACTKSA